MKTMQKFFFMMLVVLMGGMMASCGSDSDSDDNVDSFTLVMSISDPGTMPQEMVESINYTLEQYTKTVQATEAKAKSALDQAFDQADLSTFPTQYDYTIEFALENSKGSKVYSRYIVVKGGKITKK